MVTPFPSHVGVVRVFSPMVVRNPAAANIADQVTNTGRLALARSH